MYPCNVYLSHTTFRQRLETKVIHKDIMIDGQTVRRTDRSILLSPTFSESMGHYFFNSDCVSIMVNK